MPRTSFRQVLLELKRRHVYRVAAAYAVVAWVLMQAGNVVVEPLRLPEWTMPLLIVLLVLGFPVAVVLAWAFDLTPEGVRRTEPAPEAERGPALPAGNPKVRPAVLAGFALFIGLAAIGSYTYLNGRESSSDAAAEPGSERRSVAVLPFVNASPEAENEFFADGVMEDILTHLALVPDFSVISRTTAMRYKGSTLSVPEIAAELGVQYILEGSVRRAGNQVRITAQLIAGARDQPVWGEVYDRRLEDIFAVQTEIATSIAGALEAELSSGVASRIERRPTEDLAAYDLFLRGREDFYRYTVTGTERAIESFRAAVERDPQFALARAWLGRALAVYVYNHGGGMEWADSAVVHARMAAAQQPDLAAAQNSLGTALAALGRFAEAHSALERAVALNPSDWAAIANLGLVHAQRGRLDEAIRLTWTSLQREPTRSHLGYTNLGSYYVQLDLPDQAASSLGRAVTLAPEHLLAVYLNAAWGPAGDRPDERSRTAVWLTEQAARDRRAVLLAAELYALERDPESVARVLQPLYEDAPTTANNQLIGALYGWALYDLGRFDEGRPVLAQTEAHARQLIGQGDETAMLRISLAIVHAVRGEVDEAYRWLEEARRLGWNQPIVIEESALLDGIRGDPRYPDLLARVRAAQQEVRARVLAEEVRSGRATADR
jgi:adenylate cyclase